MRLRTLVDAARAVAESSGRLQKIHHLAHLLGQVPPDEIVVAVGFLTGLPRQGRIGVSGAAIREARAVSPAEQDTLEILEVDAALDRMASTSGAGSSAAKTGMLRDLFRRATEDEQDFLVRLLFGELRQGALEGVLLEAVARASKIPAARIRRDDAGRVAARDRPGGARRG